VKAPFWRTDIEIREDIVEEIGRLYGYDHLALELPVRSLEPAKKDSLLTTKAKIRSLLSKSGANEVLTYSFVHGDLLARTGQEARKAFQVANALSPDLQYYRISLMPSLLEKVHANIKAGYDEFALFEIGKVHSLDRLDDDGLPIEDEYTALVVTANDKLKKTGAAYYQARKYLEVLTSEELVFKPIGEDMQQFPVVQPYDPQRAAIVSDRASGAFLGIIGEFKPTVSRILKLPKYTAGFEVDTTELAKLFEAVNYQPLPRFPKVSQDITLKLNDDVPYQDLADFVSQELTAQQPKNSLTTLKAIGIYQKDDEAGHKNITFRLTISNHDRTLTDKEINGLLNEVATAAKAKLGAERV
jgi:phenylalanyl-tRNA synthetase beta chain